MIGTLLIWGFFLLIGYGLYRLVRAMANGPAEQLVRQLALEHRDALALKFVESVRSDEYGKANFDQWHAEVQYFVRSVVKPKLKSFFQQIYYESSPNGVPPYIYKLIAEIARKRVAEMSAGETGHAAEARATEPGGHIAYETYIVERLRHLGWSAITSVGRTGDVIAEKNRLRVAVRPLLQNGPVDAPEIRAALVGKDRARADQAAVVTNAGFNSAAEHAAASAGVILLLDSRISELERLSAAAPSRRLA